MSMRKLLPKYARGLKVDIEPMRGRARTVVLNGHTGCFHAYAAADRLLWIDYDRPGGTVKQYYDCETRAPFWLNGEECFELHAESHERRDSRFALVSRSDQYVAVRRNDVAELLWLHRDADPSKDAPDNSIQIRSVVTPRRIKLGDRWTFTEHHFWRGGGGVSRHSQEADGLFRVQLFDREYRTLRIRGIGRGRKQMMYDSYVDLATGLTIFFRRYNGPGWGNLDALADEERVTVGRTTFLHYYDSVPFRE